MKRGLTCELSQVLLSVQILKLFRHLALTIRQWYLFNQIIDFCAEEAKDVVCPKPSVPLQKTSGISKGDVCMGSVIPQVAVGAVSKDSTTAKNAIAYNQLRNDKAKKTLDSRMSATHKTSKGKTSKTTDFKPTSSVQPAEAETAPGPANLSESAVGDEFEKNLRFE